MSMQDRVPKFDEDAFQTGWRPTGQPLSEIELRTPEILEKTLQDIFKDTGGWFEPAEPFDAWEGEEDQMQELGALEIDAPLPDLDNPIHPIFQSRNFLGLSEAAYNNMKPAFRLASLFLTDDSAVGWWQSLISGKYTKDEGSGRQYIKVPHRPIADATAKARAALILNTLANDIDFAFLPTGVNDGQWASTKDNVQLSLLRRLMDESDVEDFVVRELLTLLAGRFRILMESPNFDSLSTCHKLRTWLMLAVTLVHEITHAFLHLFKEHFAYRWNCIDISSASSKEFFNEEPYIPLDANSNEAGFAWEHSVIGRVINSRAPAECKLSLRWDKGPKMGIVPMDWVCRWFRKSSWTEMRSRDRAEVMGMREVLVRDLPQR
jgi:hypothetical protein